MSLISVLPPPSATSSIVATPPDSSPDSSPTTPSSGTASTTTASSPFFTLDYTDMETRLEQLSLNLLQKKRLHYSNGASRRSFYKTHSVPSIMVRSESSSNNSSQDSSLVSSPTDPTGPVGGLKVSKVKKMVRFADSIGLQLAHVRLLSSAPSLFTNQYNSSDDDENEDLHNMADFVWNSNTTTTNECNTSSPTSYYDHASHIDTYAQVLTDQVASCVYQHAQNSLAFDDLSPESQSTRVERRSKVCSATATSADPNQFAYDNLRFTWLGGFEQPGLAPDFYSQLKERKVCLESMCTDRFILNGFVRVLKPEELLDSTNQLDLKPRVFIRYTMNNWSSFIDYECSHFALSTTTSSTDRFKCSIILDKSKFLSSINDYKPPKSGAMDVNEMPCLKLEFAVCYEFTSHDGVCSSYWDNNKSQNYHYDCYFKII